MPMLVPIALVIAEIADGAYPLQGLETSWTLEGKKILTGNCEGDTMVQVHRSRTPLLVGACVAGVLALTGCTSDVTATPEEAPSTTAAPTPSAEAAPADDVAQFASLTTVVDENYQSREWAGSFTGTKDDATTADTDGAETDATITADGSGELTVTLPASTDPATRQVVMTLVCTGSENYWITVDQANPNRVGTTCGTDGTAIYAVPLDEPTAPTTLSVTIPDDSRFWLATYYTKE